MKNYEIIDAVISEAEYLDRENNKNNTKIKNKHLTKKIQIFLNVFD